MSAAQRPAVQAPPVQHLGAAVLIQGDEALRRLVFSLSRGIDDRRRHGKREQVVELEEFRRIAVSAWESGTSPCGHGDVAKMANVRESIAGERDWIDTAAAARLARLSRRQVQRIARSLAGHGAARRVGGAWVLDRVAFSAHLTERFEGMDDDAA